MAKRIRVGAWRQIGVRAALAAGLVAVALGGSRQPHVAAASACGPTVNPIACENQNPGDPASQWDVSGAGDASIQGFATDISVAPGGRPVISRSTRPQRLLDRHLSHGLLRRRRRAKDRDGHAVRHVAAEPAELPDQRRHRTDRLRQLGGLRIVAGARRRRLGHLFREAHTQRHRRRQPHLLRRPRDDARHIPTCCSRRRTRPGRPTTQYGGNSLYHGGPGTTPGRAYKVSYNRPITTARHGDRGLRSSTPSTRWCGGSRRTATTSATPPASTPIAAAR